MTPSTPALRSFRIRGRLHFEHSPNRTSRPNKFECEQHGRADGRTAVAQSEYDDVFLLNEIQLAWNAVLPTSILPPPPPSLGLLFTARPFRALCVCMASCHYLSLPLLSSFTHFVGAEILFPLRRVNPPSSSALQNGGAHFVSFGEGGPAGCDTVNKAPPCFHTGLSACWNIGNINAPV